MRIAPYKYALIAWASGLGLLLVAMHAWSGPLDALPDPTRPYASAPAPSTYRGGLILQSTLISPQRRIAVINGQALTVGATIAGAKIVEILPHHVVISRNGMTQKLHLLTANVLTEPSGGPRK